MFEIFARCKHFGCGFRRATTTQPPLPSILNALFRRHHGGGIRDERSAEMIAETFGPLRLRRVRVRLFCL
jgi:hypothetical protein